MKAVILAAGQGTRLRPYTNDRPKCLVELAGRPMISRLIENIHAAGIVDIVVVGGYRAEMLADHASRVVVNPAFETTNMVATLFCARSELQTDADVLLVYGDCLYESRVIADVISDTSPISVAVDSDWRTTWEQRMENPLDDAETLKLDNRGRIVELGKKPSGYDEIEGQYMGLIKVRSDRLAAFVNFWDQLDEHGPYDGKDRANMYMTSFLQLLIDSGWPVQAVITKGGWLEIDTVEDLHTYENLHESGRLDLICKLT